jgi:hypothetical protein
MQRLTRISLAFGMIVWLLAPSLADAQSSDGRFPPRPAAGRRRRSIRPHCSRALALYRRGHLGDAIAAHVTTNALVAVSVLLFGQWVSLVVKHPF